MNIIIPAAGIGSRMAPLTTNVPKAALVVNGVSILERNIDAIQRVFHDANIIVIKGYGHHIIDEITGGRTINIFNPFYRVTNSIVSVRMAKEYFEDEVLILNSDLIYDDEFLHRLKNGEGEVIVAGDRTRARVNDYKIWHAADGERVIYMGKETTRAQAEYAGATRLKGKSLELFVEQIEKMINNEQYTTWYETAVVQMIIEGKIEARMIDMSNVRWIEVDTFEELAEAREIFKRPG